MTNKTRQAIYRSDTMQKNLLVVLSRFLFFLFFLFFISSTQDGSHPVITHQYFTCILSADGKRWQSIVENKFTFRFHEKVQTPLFKVDTAVGLTLRLNLGCGFTSEETSQLCFIVEAVCLEFPHFVGKRSILSFFPTIIRHSDIPALPK